MYPMFQSFDTKVTPLTVRARGNDPAVHRFLIPSSSHLQADADSRRVRLHSTRPSTALATISSSNNSKKNEFDVTNNVSSSRNTNSDSNNNSKHFNETIW